MTRFIVIGIVVVVIILYGLFRSQSAHFECPKCGTHFQINGFKYVVSLHAGGARRVKCPHCGNTEFMQPKSGKE